MLLQQGFGIPLRTENGKVKTENHKNTREIKKHVALCIIKNEALIFREKGAENGFLRTF